MGKIHGGRGGPTAARRHRRRAAHSPPNTFMGMMISYDILDIYKKLEQARKENPILASDKRFDRSVTLEHHDGTVLIYKHAFVEKFITNETEIPVDDKIFKSASQHSAIYYIITAEHHGVHIYHQGDLKYIVQSNFDGEVNIVISREEI